MATFLKTIRKTVKHWYVPAIIGVLFVLFGIYIFATPLATYATLAILFSISFLVSGIMEIFFSVQNKDEIEGWGWYLAGGIFSTLVGLMLVANPGISAVTLPLVVAFTLLFRSIQGLGFAFELKVRLAQLGQSCYCKHFGTTVFGFTFVQPCFCRNVISGNDGIGIHLFRNYSNCAGFPIEKSEKLS